ncbi:hypothetical protein [Streptomyces mirabilis]|uniref:hypothetical protein n=1 Tax=Streptomyces mirabilis TaxID=68239 RepID=UPI0035D91B52
MTTGHLRTGLTHKALGVLYKVGSSTIGRAIREVRPLSADRGFAVPDRPGIRLRTLEDLFADAAAEDVTMRIDGKETQVAHGRVVPADGPSSPASAGRTPSRSRRSATAGAAPCGPGPSAEAGCTTRPPCAPRASPSSSTSAPA